MDHIRGRNVRISLRQNSVPIKIIRAKTIALDEDAEEGADDVCGEDTSRPFIVHNFWTISFGSFTADLGVLDSWLDDIANDALALAPLSKVIGIQFDLLNGTTKAYKAGQMTRSPGKVDVSDRKSAVMQSTKYRARLFAQATL